MRSNLAAPCPIGETPQTLVNSVACQPHVRLRLSLSLSLRILVPQDPDACYNVSPHSPPLTSKMEWCISRFDLPSAHSSPL